MANAAYNKAIEYNASDYTYSGGAVTSIAINGIHGQTFASGTEELIVIWNNHPVIYNNTTGWKFQPVALTTDTDCYFDSFLDHVFEVNGTDSNYSYNGSTWSTTTNLADSPIAKFVKEHRTRLYLYNISIGGAISKPSWCWFSDLPKNGQITWGLEYGIDLEQTASDATVTSASASFTTRNIKIGDPFVITTGANAGEYVVQAITDATTIELTTTLANSVSGSTFWVGGNYFEVSTEDGDSGMGMAETSNELFCFKKNSLWRYNSISQELRKVKTAPGTTSPRSIVESGGYVYWYHPSGIYRTAGDTEQLISSSIEDVIEGVESGYESKVCGWRNEIESTVNEFLGTVTLRDGTVIRNCIATFDEDAESMSLRSLDTTVKVACNWLESNVPKIYGGDPTSTVFQLDTGTSLNDAALPFELELKPIFPKGTESIVTFTRLRAYVENGPDVQILYKLYYKPTRKEGVFVNDEDWKPLQGSQIGEKCEWQFPLNSRASGVALKVVESSTNESFLLEKVVVYYADPANR